MLAHLHTAIFEGFQSKRGTISMARGLEDDYVYIIFANVMLCLINSSTNPRLVNCIAAAFIKRTVAFLFGLHCMCGSSALFSIKACIVQKEQNAKNIMDE